MVERLFVTMAACVLLVSCASEMKRAEGELAQIHEWLPGRYDNDEQAQEDARQRRELHTSLTLNIEPIDVPLISDHAFYLQESQTEIPQRILTQRLLTFEVVKGGRIVETVWSLAQPGRWREGSPDLFKGMMQNDAARLNGCELEWQKDGERFVATNQLATCRVNHPQLGSVHIQMRMELSPDALSKAELAFGAGDKLVQGNASEPFYRYSKRPPP